MCLAYYVAVMSKFKFGIAITYNYIGPCIYIYTLISMTSLAQSYQISMSAPRAMYTMLDVSTNVSIELVTMNASVIQATHCLWMAIVVKVQCTLCSSVSRDGIT